jgi:general secretion pathway protein C
MLVHRAFRKNFWLVTLGCVGLTAFLLARTTGFVLAAAAQGGSQQLALSPLVTAKPSPLEDLRTHATSADSVLSRNPFDHVTGNLMPAPAPGTPATQLGELSQDPSTAPACDGVKAWVISASDNPQWSFAAMSVDGNNTSQLRRRGDEIGGKQVAYIGWDRVWLASGASLCQIALFHSSVPAAIAVAPVVAGGGAGGTSGSPLDANIAKGIARKSATEFDIDRATLERVLGNPAEFMSNARIVPERDGDKMAGIRLFGIKPGTLLDAIGLENGDRLQTINGFEMSSPEKMLEAYARLRTQDRLVVQVIRRGAPLNLDYSVK